MIVIPDPILEAYGLADAEFEQLTSGHINRTYRVRRGDSTSILQRVNPIFGPEIHADIEAVTAHLDIHGQSTPRLLRSRSGALCVSEGDAVWRMQSWLPGRTILRTESPAHAAEAGRALARFHRALVDLDHVFQNKRKGIHDTPAHMAMLRASLASHANHRQFDEIEPLAQEIFRCFEASAPLPEAPLRVVHGDPKISNLLFDDNGSAIGWVDLDTLARMPLGLEIGDALRSWCNVADEESVTCTFDMDRFAAAIEGYWSEAHDFVTNDEVASFIPSTETICNELASRFCADALNESYFGWDQSRYDSASAHNIDRTRAQLSLAASLRSQEQQARSVLQRLTR